MQIHLKLNAYECTKMHYVLVLLEEKVEMSVTNNFVSVVMNKFRHKFNTSFRAPRTAFTTARDFVAPITRSQRCQTCLSPHSQFCRFFPGI